MKTTEPLLTPLQAAKMAGMSRQAFLLHVGKDIFADEVGTSGRLLFSRSTVARWIAQRKKVGARKRGPKPQSQRSAA